MVDNPYRPFDLTGFSIVQGKLCNAPEYGVIVAISDGSVVRVWDVVCATRAHHPAWSLGRATPFAFSHSLCCMWPMALPPMCLRSWYYQTKARPAFKQERHDGVTNEDEMHDYNATRDKKVTFADDLGAEGGGAGEPKEGKDSHSVQAIPKRKDGREGSKKGAGDGEEGDKGALQVP